MNLRKQTHLTSPRKDKSYKIHKAKQLWVPGRGGIDLWSCTQALQGAAARVQLPRLSLWPRLMQQHLS